MTHNNRALGRIIEVTQALEALNLPEVEYEINSAPLAVSVEIRASQGLGDSRALHPEVIVGMLMALQPDREKWTDAGTVWHTRQEFGIGRNAFRLYIKVTGIRQRIEFPETKKAEFLP